MARTERATGALRQAPGTLALMVHKELPATLLKLQLQQRASQVDLTLLPRFEGPLLPCY